jgi:hypothetical protein
MFKRLLMAAALALAMVTTAIPQASNQSLNYTQMQTAINAGTFIQDNGGCNFNTGSLLLTTYYIFTLCIANTGSCNNGNNEYVMTYGDMLACRVLLVNFNIQNGSVGTTPWSVNAPSTVLINSGTSPVTWQFHYGAGDFTSCEYWIYLNGTLLANGTNSLTTGVQVTGSYSGGLTGVLNFQAVDPTGGTCSIYYTGTDFGINYYH